MGADLYRRAQGIDARPVEPEQETKSVSRETTFTHDVNDYTLLIQTLRELSEDVGRSLRKKELRGSTIKIKMRWSDFTTLTRQTTLAHATDSDEEIFQQAQRLFEANWSQPLRLIGVGISGFDDQPQQLSLWDATHKELQDTLDSIKNRFGDDSIKRGKL
jgi:DNA polymerase-4